MIACFLVLLKGIRSAPHNSGIMLLIFKLLKWPFRIMKKIFSGRWDLFTWLSFIYLVFLVALQIMWDYENQLDRYFIFLLYMPRIFLIPVPVFLLFLSVTFGRRKSIILNLIACGFIMLVMLNPVMGEGGKGPEGSEIRVLTYNIRNGECGWEEIAGFLMRSRADIIFLQEASDMDGKSNNKSNMAELLNFYYYIRGGESREMTILSRWPIESAGEFNLGKYRKCLLGIIKHPRRRIGLINVHFDSNHPSLGLRTPQKALRNLPVYLETLSIIPRSRKAQADDLAKFLGTSPGPLIVAGDFNSPPGNYVYRIMTSYLADSFKEGGRGYGFTFTSRLPLWRIDYIFADEHFGVENSRVINPRLSDHRAVESVIFLKK